MSLPYGHDYTCPHGEPWGDCPHGCTMPNDPPPIDWYDLETPPEPSDGDPRADPHPGHRADTHAALTPERELYRDRLHSALLDTKGLDGIPEAEPLINQVLQKNSLAWLAGPPAAGKTLIALDMAGSVATGEPWQGYRCQKSTVLYLIAEGAQGIRARVRAWEAMMSMPMEGVQFLPIVVHATRHDEWNAFCDLAAEMEPGLVVIDTQARVTLGLEEIAGRDMGIYVESLERLRRASKSCILSIHHTPRDGGHMRGHSALDGAANTIIMVEKEDDLITVTCDRERGGKQKELPDFSDVHLRLTRTEGSVTIVPTAPDDKVRTGSPTVQKMVKVWWQTFGSDPVTKSMIVNAGVASERTFYRALGPLLKDGYLVKEASGRSTNYRLVRKPLTNE